MVEFTNTEPQGERSDYGVQGAEWDVESGQERSNNLEHNIIKKEDEKGSLQQSD